MVLTIIFMFIIIIVGIINHLSLLFIHNIKIWKQQQKMDRRPSCPSAELQVFFSWTCSYKMLQVLFYEGKQHVDIMGYIHPTTWSLGVSENAEAPNPF